MIVNFGHVSKSIVTHYRGLYWMALSRIQPRLSESRLKWQVFLWPPAGRAWKLQWYVTLSFLDEVVLFVS